MCRNLEVRTSAFSSCILQKQSWGRGRATAIKAVQLSTKGNVDTEEWNKQARDARLQHLEAQAVETLKNTVEHFERPAFPCALIAGDVVCIHLNLRPLHLFWYLRWLVECIVCLLMACSLYWYNGEFLVQLI